MNKPVIKGTSYILIHAANLTQSMGSTQTMERALNPESEYLKMLPDHLRSYQEVVDYAPNQVYIGNIKPDQLESVARPWYQTPLQIGKAQGPYGEIIREDNFYAYLKLVDTFDLVLLERDFVERVSSHLPGPNLLANGTLGMGTELAEIQKHVDLYSSIT